MGANQTIKRLINLLYCVKLDSDQKFNTSTEINESNEKYAVAYWNILEMLGWLN